MTWVGAGQVFAQIGWSRQAVLVAKVARDLMYVSLAGLSRYKCLIREELDKNLRCPSRWFPPPFSFCEVVVVLDRRELWVKIRVKRPYKW